MLLGKKKETDVEIPSASLADIVFLLLIFFLVTTSIDTEKGLDLVLPPPGDTEVKIPKKNIANLFINATGQAMLDNDEKWIQRLQPGLDFCPAMRDRDPIHPKCLI